MSLINHFKPLFVKDSAGSAMVYEWCNVHFLKWFILQLSWNLMMDCHCRPWECLQWDHQLQPRFVAQCEFGWHFLLITQITGIDPYIFLDRKYSKTWTRAVKTTVLLQSLIKLHHKFARKKKFGLFLVLSLRVYHVRKHAALLMILIHEVCYAIIDISLYQTIIFCIWYCY